MYLNTSLISTIAKSLICSFVITVIDWPRSSILELRRVPDIVLEAKYPLFSATTWNGDSSSTLSSAGLTGGLVASIGTVLAGASGAAAGGGVVWPWARLANA